MIKDFHELYPLKPILVALTGTDLYRDMKKKPETLSVLDWAKAIIVLQPLAIKELPKRYHSKVHVIFQSVDTKGIYHQPGFSKRPAI